MAISLKGILNSILNIFRSAAEKAWRNLDAELQTHALTAATLAQAIKTSIGVGYKDFLEKVIILTDLPKETVEDLIGKIAKDLGLNFDASYESAYLAIQNFAKKMETDNGWNGLWQNVMKFGATYLSSGKLDWVTLSYGVAQIAFEKLFKKP